MHTAAMLFVARHAQHAEAVLDVGSRDVNGSPRSLFEPRRYVGIDKVAGPGVDVVADASRPLPINDLFDVALCLEVCEHEPLWRSVLWNAAALLAPEGRMIVTCATSPREPHSAIDGGPLRDGEYYENVEPDELLLTMLLVAGRVITDVLPEGDLRVVAIR
jgi:SAM-dependent methyltransferase